MERAVLSRHRHGHATGKLHHLRVAHPIGCGKYHFFLGVQNRVQQNHQGLLGSAGNQDVVRRDRLVIVLFRVTNHRLLQRGNSVGSRVAHFAGVQQRGAINDGVDRSLALWLSTAQVDYGFTLFPEQSGGFVQLQCGRLIDGSGKLTEAHSDSFLLLRYHRQFHKCRRHLRSPAPLFYRKRKPCARRKRTFPRAACFFGGRCARYAPRHFQPTPEIRVWPEGRRKAQEIALGQLSHFVPAHESFCNYVAESLADPLHALAVPRKGSAEFFPELGEGGRTAFRRSEAAANHGCSRQGMPPQATKTAARIPHMSPPIFPFDSCIFRLCFPVRLFNEGTAVPGGKPRLTTLRNWTSAAILQIWAEKGLFAHIPEIGTVSALIP